MMDGVICVCCGNVASEGSLKHPYCRKCFIKSFGGVNDVAYVKYNKFLIKSHGV